MNIPHSPLYSTVAEPTSAPGGVEANPFDTTPGATVPPAPVEATPPPASTTPPPAAVTPPAGNVPPAPIAAVPPQAQHLTPTQIADLGASAAARVLQAQKAQAPAPQMSQEEFDRTFNVHKLDDKAFTAITGYAPEKPEQVAALNQALQGIARQSLTMAQALMAQRIEALKSEIMGQFEPVRMSHQAQFEKQLRDDFFLYATDLKDFGPLVETVAAGIKASGQKFATKEELFKFAADKTRSLLPANVLQQATTAPAAGVTPQNTQPTVQRRMTPVSTGGQVSAGSSSAAKQSDAQTIFG